MPPDAGANVQVTLRRRQIDLRSFHQTSRKGFSLVLRRMLLAASASPRLRQLVTTTPATRGIVDSYVAGDTAPDAVRVTRALRAAGLLVSLDYLGEDTRDQAQAAAVTDEYIQLLGQLGAEGLTHGGGAEVSVKPTAVGLFLGAGTRGGQHRADLRGRGRGGHDGDARRRGARGHRADAADRRETAGRASRSRLCRAGLPAARRGGLPGAGRPWRAGQAVQGRLQRARERRLHRSPGGRPVLRALPAGAAERTGLPDAGHPRPAADRDRRARWRC